MSLKAKLEAIIYAADTPITLDHILQLVKDSVVPEVAPEDSAEAKNVADDADAKSRVRVALEELIADYGICRSRYRNPTGWRVVIECPRSPSSTTWCVTLRRV